MLETPERGASGIVDYDVDASVALHDIRDPCLDLLIDAHIDLAEMHGGTAGNFCSASYRSPADFNNGSGFEESLGDPCTNTAATTRNEYYPSLEVNDD